MADITNSTAVRDFIASRMTTAGGVYYFATLHNASGSAITAGQTYAASGIGELTTANGYTAGGVALGTAVSGTNPSWAGSITATNGALSSASNAIWTAATNPLTAEYCAVWVNSSASITGAQLVCMKNSSQTASVGQTMTATIGTIITIPTPA